MTIMPAGCFYETFFTPYFSFDYEHRKVRPCRPRPGADTPRQTSLWMLAAARMGDP